MSHLHGNITLYQPDLRRLTNDIRFNIYNLFNALEA